MNSKHNLTDFAASIAKKTGTQTSVVRHFLSSMGPLIEEALRTDGSVRIAGLGTLRLVQTEDRRSIDVNTGRDIVIKGYTKVSFTPEAALKTRINEPFAAFTPIEVTDDATLITNNDTQVATIIKEAENIPEQQDENADFNAENDTLTPSAETDPLARLNEQAEEIKDILAEINGQPEASDRPEEPNTQTPVEETDAPKDADLQVAPTTPTAVTPPNDAPHEPRATMPTEVPDEDLSATTATIPTDDVPATPPPTTAPAPSVSGAAMLTIQSNHIRRTLPAEF